MVTIDHRGDKSGNNWGHCSSGCKVNDSTNCLLGSQTIMYVCRWTTAHKYCWKYFALVFWWRLSEGEQKPPSVNAGDWWWSLSMMTPPDCGGKRKRKRETEKRQWSVCPARELLLFSLVHSAATFLPFTWRHTAWNTSFSAITYFFFFYLQKTKGTLAQRLGQVCQVWIFVVVLLLLLLLYTTTVPLTWSKGGGRTIFSDKVNVFLCWSASSTLPVIYLTDRFASHTTSSSPIAIWHSSLLVVFVRSFFLSLTPVTRIFLFADKDWKILFYFFCYCYLPMFVLTVFCVSTMNFDCFKAVLWLSVSTPLNKFVQNSVSKFCSSIERPQCDFSQSAYGPY